MSEPFYIRQSGEPMTESEQMEWFAKSEAEAIAKGAIWTRRSFDPILGDLCLVEGWKELPADEGAPRFQLQHAA